ncbi:MAG: hypothetical protein HYR60_18800 [Acidobacteria bacterium]|nr:hypothetical protein [Acidobacteriota bacterium]
MLIQRAAYSTEPKRVDPSSRVVSSLTQKPASGNQGTQIDRAMRGLFNEVNKKRKTAREESGHSFFGTIFGGPIMGTLIGQAIGNSANDSDQDAAREQKKQNGATSLAPLLAQSFTSVAYTGDRLAGKGNSLLEDPLAGRRKPPAPRLSKLLKPGDTMPGHGTMTPGSTIAHYKITAQAWRRRHRRAVYRATDTKLDRDVVVG